MSIFRTSLPETGKSPRPSVTVLLKAFGQRLAQSFQAHGMLQVGMLEGVLTTIEENARKERLRALYPASYSHFGVFAESPVATAMQSHDATRR